MHRRGVVAGRGQADAKSGQTYKSRSRGFCLLFLKEKPAVCQAFFCCLHDKGSVFLPVRKKQEPEALVICLADRLMDGGGQFPETAGEGGQEQIPDICLVRLKGRGRDLHPGHSFLRVHSGFRKICDQADGGKRGAGCLESQK